MCTARWAEVTDPQYRSGSPRLAPGPGRHRDPMRDVAGELESSAARAQAARRPGRRGGVPRACSDADSSTRRSRAAAGCWPRTHVQVARWARLDAALALLVAWTEAGPLDELRACSASALVRAQLAFALKAGAATICAAAARGRQAAGATHAMDLPAPPAWTRFPRRCSPSCLARPGSSALERHGHAWRLRHRRPHPPARRRTSSWMCSAMRTSPGGTSAAVADSATGDWRCLWERSCPTAVGSSCWLGLWRVQVRGPCISGMTTDLGRAVPLVTVQACPRGRVRSASFQSRPQLARVHAPVRRRAERSAASSGRGSACGRRKRSGSSVAPHTGALGLAALSRPRSRGLRADRGHEEGGYRHCGARPIGITVSRVGRTRLLYNGLGRYQKRAIRGPAGSPRPGGPGLTTNWGVVELDRGIRPERGARRLASAAHRSATSRCTRI